MNDTPRGSGICRGLLGAVVTFFILDIMATEGLYLLNDSLLTIFITSAAVGAVTGLFAYHHTRIRTLEQRVEYLARQVEKLEDRK
ncbi:hypothetical protein KL86CLO1_12300 [uncultured Eubacteriales bacterium]|uniref:Uncharacterized protein n=1 Tax=uncultured Eubacteriales bacterium TaxID=172733 RepID=A0A212K6V0_9FIRM|nr:hypothetical protein KL86CLO1_12300 [uncultured Eubacteriales bacterium]